MEVIHYLERSRLFRILVHGPHSEFARVFADRLLADQLSQQCTMRSLRLFRNLKDWHAGYGNRAGDLDEKLVARFVEHRCRHWDMDRWDNATLRRVLSALRGQGLIAAAAPVELTPQQVIVEAFSAHLTHDRGLTRSTVGSQVPHVRRLLEEIDPAGTSDFATLTVSKIIGELLQKHVSHVNLAWHSPARFT